VTEADKVFAAKTPEDLFGPIGSNRDLWLERAKAKFKKYSRVLHPDKPTGNEDAFKILNTLWVAAQSDSPRAPSRETVLITRKNAFTVTENAPRWSGAIAEIIPVTYGDPEHVGIVKVARSSKSRDLLDAEWRALVLMTEDCDDRRTNFIPRPVEQFTWKDGAKQRRVNALSWPSEVGPAEKWWSIAELRKVHTNGINPRDVAWIFKRLLIALELAESNRLVHCNVTPSHVLVQPELHALMLVGWAGAVKGGEKPKIISPDERWGYHNDVLEKKPMDTYVDLSMAGFVGNWALCEYYRQVPKMSRFFDGLKRGIIKDVDVVRRAYNELLFDQFGAPKFHSMATPTRRP
jgi:hypothetical protein